MPWFGKVVCAVQQLLHVLQVATDEDMDMWTTERRGAEIQATQVAFSQKVEFLAADQC